MFTRGRYLANQKKREWQRSLNGELDKGWDLLVKVGGKKGAD